MVRFLHNIDSAKWSIRHQSIITFHEQKKLLIIPTTHSNYDHNFNEIFESSTEFCFSVEKTASYLPTFLDMHEQFFKVLERGTYGLMLIAAGSLKTLHHLGLLY